MKQLIKFIIEDKVLIGIFWIYKKEIYLKEIEADTVKAIKNFKDSDFSHYQAWGEISLQNKDFYLYEYEDIPRGRVVYDIENIQYIVCANNDIVISDEAKELIVNRFALQKSKFLFKYDEHYEIKTMQDF